METFIAQELSDLWQAVYSLRAEIARGEQNGQTKHEVQVLGWLLDKIKRIQRADDEVILHATVEVYGGVADVTHADTRVEVTIIDHDNLEAEAEATA